MAADSETCSDCGLGTGEGCARADACNATDQRDRTAAQFYMRCTGAPTLRARLAAAEARAVAADQERINLLKLYDVTCTALRASEARVERLRRAIASMVAGGMSERGREKGIAALEALRLDLEGTRPSEPPPRGTP